MSVVKAVFKRNLAAFFGSPAGYVFIILFVGLTAWVAFVAEGFFMANQANLNNLTMNMPWILMIFVSSITMSTWAEEKKLGTDELLFTLPGKDFQVVIGKFLADLAVLTAALVFTLSHVFVLKSLGDPDMGLMFSTYLGYWLLGAAFIATGMFASSLTSNTTVGFILGALFCAVFAFAHKLSLVFPGKVGESINAFAAITHLQVFCRGVISFKDLIYFASIVVMMLYLNSIVVGSRRWPGGKVDIKENPKVHYLVRVLAMAVILISVNVLVSRVSFRADITEEKLSSLSEETKQILSDLKPEKPVYIQAWVSKEVPPGYINTRDNLIGLLKEYDEMGGDSVVVNIYRPEKFSQESRDAKEKYEIHPVSVPSQDEGGVSMQELFLGAVFTCGVEEKTVPFFHSGIPVEYELTRTIRVVSKAQRPKVGIVDNELKILGGFDFQTRSRSNPWQIVEELRKQYNVEGIRADAPIPDDVDVIMIALPSLLKEKELENVIAAIKGGKPALLLMDPLPIMNLGLSPMLPRPSPQANPMMMGRQPPGEPKAELNKLLNILGVRWMKDTIAWDLVNPHPQLNHLSPEFVFVTHKEDDLSGFSQKDQVSSGLQELLAFFPGAIKRFPGGDSKLSFEPLLRTGNSTSGMIKWQSCVSQTFFGPSITPLEQLKRTPHNISNQDYILAARIHGQLAQEKPVKEEADSTEEKPEEAPAKAADINVILIADLDMISDQLFEIRKSNFINFDNVPFVLNCVDSLAKDDSYISLRKRRRLARTLTEIEKLDQEFMQAKMGEEALAEAGAQAELSKAQANFDEKVKAVEERTDLDKRQKDIMLQTVQNVEQRRLAAQKQKIEQEKNRKVEESRFAMEQERRKIRVKEKFKAMIGPILIPLCLAVFIFVFRSRRENRGALKTRSWKV